MFGHKSGADLSTQSALIQPIEDVRHAMTADARAGAIVEYVVELIGFPGTKYGDQVDSTIQALDSYAGGRCLGDLPQGVRSIAPAQVLAQLRKNAIAVGSGTPSSARGCRIAEITGSNPLSSTTKSAQTHVISYATG